MVFSATVTVSSVQVKNVRKVFDSGFEAVADISFTIGNGDVAVLVGPSGCGKTTVLRMVAGLETCTEGKILIDDVVVNRVPPKDRDVAMVFQDYALYPHMSIHDNLAIGLRLRKYNREEIRTRVGQVAKVLEIHDILHRKPKQLSGGEQQRVAIGRAIVRKPQVFLFDEPLSNLDAQMRVQMRGEIVKIAREMQTSMIYVTHDQAEAMTMGDKIILMRDGRVEQQGSPKALYQHPANMFVASFIGTPSMNLVRGQLARGEELYFESADIAVAVPGIPQLLHYSGKHVVMGFRPEHVYLLPQETSPSRGVALPALEVGHVEWLGPEVIIYGSIGQTDMVARTQYPSVPSRGDIVHLKVNIDNLHFFHDSGDAMYKR